MLLFNLFLAPAPPATTHCRCTFYRLCLDRRIHLLSILVGMEVSFGSNENRRDCQTVWNADPLKSYEMSDRDPLLSLFSRSRMLVSRENKNPLGSFGFLFFVYARGRACEELKKVEGSMQHQKLGYLMSPMSRLAVAELRRKFRWGKQGDSCHLSLCPSASSSFLAPGTRAWTCLWPASTPSPSPNLPSMTCASNLAVLPLCCAEPLRQLGARRRAGSRS